MGAHEGRPYGGITCNEAVEPATRGYDSRQDDSIISQFALGVVSRTLQSRAPLYLDGAGILM
jgi:hypothetical protein